MAKRKKNGNRNGGYNHIRSLYTNVQNHNNKRKNHSNNPQGKNKAGKCNECGSWDHYANQCNATPEEKKWKSHFNRTNFIPNCPYCGKDNSHFPVNCFKNPSKPSKPNTYNSNNKQQHDHCDFCKRRTNHTFQSCQEVTKWKAAVGELIAIAATDLPYCIVCGGNHGWRDCPSGRRERREREFIDKSQRTLMEWIQSPPDTDISRRNVAFCGYCEDFGQHNTRNCYEAVNEYLDNKYNFLSLRFGQAFDSEYSSEDEQFLERRGSIKIDGKRKLKVNKPVVEKKCRMCRTVLPKAIKPTDSQPDHEIVVSCVNPRCKQLNVLNVENSDGSTSNRGSNNWGGLNITTREHAARFLADAERDFHPHYARYRVTTDSKGQPYYDGPEILTMNAARHFGTGKYSNNGYWHFNDLGNFQPFFPPATCQFTNVDTAVRAEPNFPINHTRSGLIPFCSGCGLFGTVVDEDEDVVMAQTGPEMEGNYAGSGPGYVVFENPMYRLGGNNSPEQCQYLTGLRCWCGVTRGAEPDIAWVKERKEALPPPPMLLDLTRPRRLLR